MLLSHYYDKLIGKCETTEEGIQDLERLLKRDFSKAKFLLPYNIIFQHAEGLTLISLFDPRSVICDVTRQNKALVATCHLPQIKC